MFVWNAIVTISWNQNVFKWITLNVTDLNIIQLFTDVEGNSGGYLSSREAAS